MAEAPAEETIHEYKGSSSSDSESEKQPPLDFKKKRLFGRKEPVHTILGGGRQMLTSKLLSSPRRPIDDWETSLIGRKFEILRPKSGTRRFRIFAEFKESTADIVLWRNKQMSASILASVTVLWLLFECIGYHFLTFICHSVIFFLVVLFFWSSAASFIKRPPPNFPDVILPEDLFLSIAHSVRHKINATFAIFRNVASGKDLKKFLMIITGLWVLSIIGSWFSFLTFLYIVFVLLYSLPALYDKYEDQVDAAAEKATTQMNKQYAVLDAKLLCKIPRCPFSDKKKH